MWLFLNFYFLILQVHFLDYLPDGEYWQLPLTHNCTYDGPKKGHFLSFFDKNEQKRHFLSQSPPYKHLSNFGTLLLKEQQKSPITFHSSTTTTLQLQKSTSPSGFRLSIYSFIQVLTNYTSLNPLPQPIQPLKALW